MLVVWRPARRDPPSRDGGISGVAANRLTTSTSRGLERLAVGWPTGEARDGVAQHDGVGEVARMHDAVAVGEALADPRGEIVGGVQLFPLGVVAEPVAGVGEVERRRSGVEPPRRAVAGR